MLPQLLELLNKKEDITADDILSFTNVKATIKEGGGFSVVDSAWNLHSKIILNKGDVANLTEERIETTIGRAIANRLLKIDPFGTFYKYENHPLHINKFIDNATVDLMNGGITSQQMAKLFNNAVWLTRFASMILPSLSQKILVTPKASVALREKLIKENAAAIAAGDISYVHNVEKPVLNSIVNELKDDPSFMMYRLKKPSVGNHLKQTIGTFSPVLNPTTGKYEFPQGNLMTGLSSENYNILANMNIAGTYSRAVQTQDGGAIVKSLYNSMNTINAAPADTDCKTTLYKRVHLIDDLKKAYMWNYMVVEGGGLILLTPDNFSRFVNKICYFRSPLFCKYENRFEICNKCCGEIPYRTKLMSIGSLTSRVGANFVQLSLKSFHDSTIELVNLDPFGYMRIK